MSDPKSPHPNAVPTEEALSVNDTDTRQAAAVDSEDMNPENTASEDSAGAQNPDTEDTAAADAEHEESAREDSGATDGSEPVETDPAAHDDVDLGDALPDDDDTAADTGDPYAGHEHESLKRILESALFASGATLSVNHLRDIFEPYERPQNNVVRQIMTELMAFYEGRGIQLVEVASGYRFQTEPGTAKWISRLWDEKPQRYSRALMETIALIAYRQPITRGEIEDVRGVAVSSSIIRTLLEREWVRVVGHRDVPGRPAMYATTRQFLDYFGLKSLDQLPSLSEIRDMDELNPQMPLEDGEAAQNETQSEISFSGMIEKMRESESTGRTGSDYIDDHLDGELAAMDDVNTSFEKALEHQRAEHEHPYLTFNDDDADEANANKAADDAAEDAADNAATDEPVSDEPASAPEQATAESEDPELSDEEKWKVIQEKLAQQQALLDDRESDPQGEEDSNE